MSAQMTRRGLLAGLGKAGIGAAVLGVGAASLLKPQPAVAAMPWHGYSQAYRNSLILNRAWSDYGKKVYRECKPWVQDVVNSASQGVVMPPITNPDNCTWVWSQDVYGYYMSRPIQYAQPGEIVQIRLRNYPYLHTAIVSSVMSNRVGFIESNVSPPYGLTVGYREVTFADFANGNIHCFSIYTIL